MAATLNLTFYDATGIDTYYYLNHRKTIDNKFVNGSGLRKIYHSISPP